MSEEDFYDSSCSYEDFACAELTFVGRATDLQIKQITSVTEMLSGVGAPYSRCPELTDLEQDLVDLAYSHTVGDKEMAYEIGENIYSWLKSLDENIDTWYEEKFKK